jgi:hypothetical protein
MKTRYLLDMEKSFRKISKFTIAIVATILFAFINTLKGTVIGECGFKWQFWVVESLSLLIGTFLLYFFWRLIDESRCSTVINERIEK